MEKANIIGIGVISALGNSVQEIWERLNTKPCALPVSEKLEYVSCLPSAKRRRLNRYSDMALYSAVHAEQEAAAIIANVKPERIGTIYSTGYGPMNSNLEFANQVRSGDPDLCSPTLFSSTVSNNCLGHICMNLNCKGVSTILMGANSLGYSQMLLSKKAADFILSGAIDEYTEELFECFSRSPKAKGIHFCESAVTLLLAGGDTHAENAYCSLVDFGECDLGGYPVFQPIDEELAVSNMKSMLSQITEGRKIDLVISAENGIAFDRVEQEAFQAVLPEISCIRNVKSLFGETLGAAFHINTLVAGLILKHNQIPAALNASPNAPSDIHCILVAGYNVSGNYIAYLLEKT